jgi:hypothetical protein
VDHKVGQVGANKKTFLIIVLKNLNNRSLIGNMVCFPKKIGTKLFIFLLKKNYCFIFLLSLGARVYFRGKKLIFWQK